MLDPAVRKLPGGARIDARGRPAADPRVERVCRIVAIVACVGFALAAFWGIAAPFGSGHVAAVAARGVVADNMWHWGILAPVREYSLSPPVQSQYYTHHPWGVFWATAVVYEIFGHYDFVCRLPAVLMSVATPPLLWGIARSIWGPVAGALAACAYAVLPISLAFAQFNGFEVPVIFSSLLVTWAYVRYSQTWSLKWLAVSVVAMIAAACSDWEVFVFIGVILGVLGLAGLLLPQGWFGAVDTRRFSQWWMLVAGVAVVGGAGWLALFQKLGHLEDLMGSHATRTAGNEATLDRVLEARRHWNQLMFTPLAIFVGKLATLVFAVRLVLLRKLLDVFPIALLAMALFQYLHFKQGADVHIFWPQVFAPYFALSLAVLATVFERGVSWVVARIRKREAGVGPAFAALAVFFLVPLAMLPDAAAVLVYAHHTGLRLNEKGHAIRQDLDKTAALRWMRRRIEGRGVVELHRSMDYTWSQEWTLRRPLQGASTIPSAPSKSARYFVADARALGPADQKKLAERFQVVALGPFWMVDYETPQGPFEGHAIEPRAPGFFERYFRAPVDPIYELEPDAFRTWELRDHFGQQPNPAPGAPARTAEQRRIAHNVATATGDVALADRLRGEIARDLDRSMATAFDDGSELLGLVHDTLRHEMWIYVRAAGPTQASQTFSVRSRIEKPKTLSLIEPDDIERRVFGHIELDTTLWKKGYLYVIRAEVRPRLGREVYEGYFSGKSGPGLRLKGGGSRIRLLTVN